MTGDDIAIKLEPADTDNPKLRDEWKVYQALGQGVGIPRVFWFGLEGSYRALIMSLLGPSLGDLFSTCGQNFSVKTVLMLAIQLVSYVTYLLADHVADDCLDFSDRVYP